MEGLMSNSGLDFLGIIMLIYRSLPVKFGCLPAQLVLNRRIGAYFFAGSCNVHGNNAGEIRHYVYSVYRLQHLQSLSNNCAHTIASTPNAYCAAVSGSLGFCSKTEAC